MGKRDWTARTIENDVSDALDPGDATAPALSAPRPRDAPGDPQRAQVLRPGGDCRIFNLGPAFGTKFLYFAQPQVQRPQALIHDSAMSKWLREQAGLKLDSGVWSVRRYGAYLQQMHRWAEVLGCKPDDVELCIFRSSLPPTSRWADTSAGSRPAPHSQRLLGRHSQLAAR